MSIELEKKISELNDRIEVLEKKSNAYSELTWCRTCSCEGYVFVKDKTSWFGFNKAVTCPECKGDMFVPIRGDK